MSVNKVILVGRLGQDPELRFTPSGSAVCNFTVATSETWTDKNNGQKNEKTEWHRVVVWGKLGELCNQYLAKGRQAYIEGRLQTRSWDDQQSGQKRYTTEVVAATVQFLGGNAQPGTGAERRETTSTRPEANHSAMEQDYQVSPDNSFTADDIPF